MVSNHHLSFLLLYEKDWKDMEIDIKKRLLDLANRSYNSSMYTFTDFLGLAEQNDFHQIENNLHFAGIKLYGGYDNADRIVIRFGDEALLGYDLPFEINCIHIKPVLKKFSDDLTHRDFLGALMNLGIDRSTLGDIKVSEKEAYVFCLSNITEYICDNLTKVKHTSVICQVIEDISRINEIIDEEPDEKTIIVSSLRVDAVISKVYNLSRSQSLELFSEQKVYINGRLETGNATAVKEWDIVNVRGYGKFKITDNIHDTKKGRISVDIMIW